MKSSRHLWCASSLSPLVLHALISAKGEGDLTEGITSAVEKSLMKKMANIRAAHVKSHAEGKTSQPPSEKSRPEMWEAVMLELAIRKEVPRQRLIWLPGLPGALHQRLLKKAAVGSTTLCLSVSRALFNSASMSMQRHHFVIAAVEASGHSHTDVMLAAMLVLCAMGEVCTPSENTGSLI